MATKNQLNDIVAIENVITGIIDGGFIDTYDKLIDTILDMNGRRNGVILLRL